MKPRAITVKHVREHPVRASLDERGVVAVAVKSQGVVFSFPLAVWPEDSFRKAAWIERLTPHWDMGRPEWSPQCQRLRDACQSAINILQSMNTTKEQQHAP